MGFSRQEYWSGFPFPSPGDVPDPGMEPRSPALRADTLPSEPPGKPDSEQLANPSEDEALTTHLPGRGGRRRLQASKGPWAPADSPPLGSASPLALPQGAAGGTKAHVCTSHRPQNPPRHGQAQAGCVRALPLCPPPSPGWTLRSVRRCKLHLHAARGWGRGCKDEVRTRGARTGG